MMLQNCPSFFIFKWVSNSGQTWTVLTVQEIIEGKKVSQEIVIKALQCEVFEDNYWRPKLELNVKLLLEQHDLHLLCLVEADLH